MVELIEITMPDGGSVLAEVVVLGSDVGALSRFDLSEVSVSAARIGEYLRDAITRSLSDEPDRLAVEIGLKLAVKSGTLVSVLAEASGEASVTVHMEWDRRGSADGGQR